MTIVVFIWQGTISPLGSFNAAFFLETGHASLAIIKPLEKRLIPIQKVSICSWIKSVFPMINNNRSNAEYIENVVEKNPRKIKEIVDFLAKREKNTREKKENNFYYISHIPRKIGDNQQGNTEIRRLERIYKSIKQKFYSLNRDKNLNEDKKFFSPESWTEKRKEIYLETELRLRKQRRRNKYPDILIFIDDLNEEKMIQYAEKYLKEKDLPEDEVKYHILKNNCCSVVARILHTGIESNQDSYDANFILKEYKKILLPNLIQSTALIIPLFMLNIQVYLGIENLTLLTFAEIEIPFSFFPHPVQFSGVLGIIAILLVLLRRFIIIPRQAYKYLDLILHEIEHRTAKSKNYWNILSVEIFSRKIIDENKRNNKFL